MRKIKKIKGGLNINFINEIRNLETYNNLKTLKELKELKIVNEDNFFIDENGEIIIDVILEEPIKYENAFLLENNLFYIYSLYNWVIINEKNNDPYTRIPISDTNILKIKNFRFDSNLISNYLNDNNLKTEEELKKLDLIDSEGFFIDRSEKRIKDPLKDIEIRYENAFLLGDFLYHINSLYLHVIIKNNNNIKGFYKEDLLLEHIKKILFFSNNRFLDTSTFNNLKSLEEIKRMGLVDDDNFFIDMIKDKIKDPITNEPIKYEKAIYINGLLYDINSIFNFIFSQRKLLDYYLKLPISKEDFEKIKLFKFNSYSLSNPSNYNNLKSLEEIKIMGFVDEQHFLLDKFKNRILFPVSLEHIKYENAILINGIIYNIKYIEIYFSLKSKKDYFKDNITMTDYLKIKSFKFDTFLIIDTNNYNNLKPMEEIKQIGGFLDEDNFFIDRNRNRLKDPISKNSIKYENSILINGILYDIDFIYVSALIEKHTIDYVGDEISSNDINKIKLFKIDTSLLSNPSNFNNLKFLQFLNRLDILDDEHFFVDRTKQRIKDPITKEPIKYESAILINGILYDIEDIFISVFIKKQKTDYLQQRIKHNDIQKIKDFKYRDTSLLANPFSSNNLKSLDELKQLRYVNSQNFFVDRYGYRFKDPITKKEIRYENAILINGVLYDIEDIYISVFRENKKIDNFDRNINNNDIKKIRLFRTYDDNRLDKTKPNNLKSLDELRRLGLVNTNNYFIDRNRNIIKDIINPKYPIKYDEAILINGFLYDIETLFEWIFEKYKTHIYDYFEEEIFEDDIIKINKFFLNIDEIYDSSSYNNIKSIDVLNSLGYSISIDDFFQTKRGRELLDLQSNVKIKYANIILINNILCDVNELLKFIKINGLIDYNGNQISSEDFNKIKFYRYDIQKIYDPTSFNNLKSYYELNRLNIFDTNNRFLDRNGNIIIDMIDNLPIQYKNAIIINGTLYNLKICEFTKDYFGNEIKSEDKKKCKNYIIDIDGILDTTKPNNLKSLEELKEMGVVNKNNLLLKRDKNFVIEPINYEYINYKNAILINRTIYNINSLFKNVFSSHIFEDNSRNKISIEDLRKIFHYKNEIFDVSNSNKLKTFNELKTLKLIDNQGFIQRNYKQDDYILINDFYSHKGIKYENAILINGLLYDVNSIFEKVIIEGNNKDFFDLDISQEDYDKIFSFRHKFISDFSRPNNIRTLEQLQTLKVLNENNFFINEDGNKITDLKTQRPIKYEDGFLFNEVLYDINELYKWVFEENGENYKKTFYSGEIISINEVIKIYNYKNNINPELSIELFVNNSQKVKDNYELIKDLGINPDLKEIDKIIKDNYELVLSISHIDIPRLVASIIFTKMLIFFFDMFKKDEEEEFKYREILFKKICDISYYNFEIFINYCLVKNISTTSYINIFIRDIKNSMNDIEQKSLYIYILIQKYLYDIPLKLMKFPTTSRVFKPKRKELLNAIILKITNEYNKILKYILKTQEYIIKIFKYYNYYFISYIDNSHKNLDYLREIISNLYKNIEKQHKKSIQAYNKAYKASEEYKKYKSPIFSQSISKLFQSRRISNYNSPIFSPSISIPSP